MFTSSTFSSVKSEDTPSLFDSGSSIHATSDTSSNRGSIISNASNRTTKFLSRRSHSSLRSAAGIDDLNLDDDVPPIPSDRASISSASKQKGAFMCGFCKEENIQKTCTRKNDLKRHIEDFHNMNAQWFCRHRGCQIVFDWQTAYKAHLKHAHGGSRMSLDDAKVNLCPQTVFACGFENCFHVFESPTDEDIGATFKDYVAHVVKHFDEGVNSGEWTYSARVRNLLRQSGVLRAWTNSTWSEADRSQLKWHPQSTAVMRKRLETRHIGDLQLLIQYAVALGSDPTSIHAFREDFVTPIADHCQMNIHGHRPRPQPAAISPPAPPAPTESDPFSFKISRGSNPGLAAYLASQRRVYVPRPSTRSGRSARAPQPGILANARSHPAMASQYSFQGHATPSLYDAGSQQHHARPQPQQHHAQHQNMRSHPQSHHAQSFGIITQVEGDIDSGSMRGFRGLPQSSTSETDIDMGDSQMMNSDFMHQQDFSTTFLPPNLPNSSTSSDDCHLLTSPTMLEHSQYGTYPGPHAF